MPILAAGGIVLRGTGGPQFAVVQLRKLGAWGLPKGKLAIGEDAMPAARREVLEETGHRVTIHEFLGTLAYEASGRPKVVQFWRMQAIGEPIGGLMPDVKAVRWLALEDAICQLTHLREQVFLEQVGPIALKFAEGSARRAAVRGRVAGRAPIRRGPPAARIQTIPTLEKTTPLAPCEPVEQGLGEHAGLVPARDVLTPVSLSEPAGQDQNMQAGAGRDLIEKTLTWLRDAAMLGRQPLD